MIALPAVARRTLAAVTSWPGDGTQRLDALLEGADGGAQALQAHRADQVGRVEERLAVGDQHAADGGHELGAVEEAEALFGLQRDGREPGGLQGRPARLAPPVLRQQLALAHHREHEVRGRGEVAGGAQRAPRRHPRHDVGVDARGQVLGHREPDARVAARHRVQADGHRRAHDLARERRAQPDGVAAHQVLLQLADLVDGDVRGGQQAEAGGDAVGDLLAGDDGGDDVVGRLDALARGSAEGHLGPAARDGDDLVDGERRVADDELRHVVLLLLMASPSRRASSDGEAATGMPAASRAACLVAAVPDVPSTMAPAWPMRRPGGALWPAT